MSWKTPLPYIGGKSRAVRILAPYVPDGLTAIGSPFFGGGSFEFYLSASRGVDIIAGDNFFPLVNFWQWVEKDRHTLIDEIKKRIPVAKQDIWDYRAELKAQCPPTAEAAAKIYICYCAGYSSKLSGGHTPEGLAKDNQRNWQGRRKSIRTLHIPGTFKITHTDVFDFLTQNPNLWLYLDPPYLGVFSTSVYYGWQDSPTNDEFDHAKLAQTLRDTDRKFLLSYLDTPEIRDYYAGWTDIHEVTWQHASKAVRRKKYGKAREMGRELAIVRK